MSITYPKFMPGSAVVEAVLLGDSVAAVVVTGEVHDKHDPFSETAGTSFRVPVKLSLASWTRIVKRIHKITGIDPAVVDVAVDKMAYENGNLKFPLATGIPTVESEYDIAKQEFHFVVLRSNNITQQKEIFDFVVPYYKLQDNVGKYDYEYVSFLAKMYGDSSHVYWKRIYAAIAEAAMGKKGVIQIHKMPIQHSPSAKSVQQGVGKPLWYDQHPWFEDLFVGTNEGSKNYIKQVEWAGMTFTEGGPHNHPAAVDMAVGPDMTITHMMKSPNLQQMPKLTTTQKQAFHDAAAAVIDKIHASMKSKAWGHHSLEQSAMLLNDLHDAVAEGKSKMQLIAQLQSPAAKLIGAIKNMAEAKAKIEENKVVFRLRLPKKGGE